MGLLVYYWLVREYFWSWFMEKKTLLVHELYSVCRQRSDPGILPDVSILCRTRILFLISFLCSMVFFGWNRSCDIDDEPKFTHTKHFIISIQLIHHTQLFWICHLSIFHIHRNRQFFHFHFLYVRYEFIFAIWFAQVLFIC